MHFINRSDTVIWSSPQVVWSANPDRSIQENATLEFTSDGNLILHDADGSLVWSSGTRNRSVAGMELTELGNLVLFDRMKAPVWQSFDHPTDVLVPGQSLLEGMRLTASATNWTQFQIYYYMTVLSYGLYAYVDSTPPQLYFSRWAAEKKVTFTNASLGSITLPAAKYTQFLRFESDGHLRLYEWSDKIGEEWLMVSDVMKMFLDDCSFPTACGEYRVCTGRQCICPSPTSDSRMQYFKPVDGKTVNQGCLPQTPVSCQEMQHHELLFLPDVSYFDTSSNVIGDARSRDDCKQACLNNCSCKAVIYRYGSNDSYGKCSWLTNVFTLQSIDPETVQYNSSAYIKVQVRPSPTKKKVILGAIFAGVASIVLATIAATIYYVQAQRRRKNQDTDGDFDFGQFPGMPMRFSYEKLRECTEDFSKMLGEGGFGSVFEGKLDGETVAVKRLESTMQGKKEFLAEVETIGSIEHINLVRLIGFCAEKSHRLLVYEYMPRGSLDRWIYYRHNNAPLDWGTRCRIILDIAKGLCYLHEECRRKIAHLDIKPQNILSDENFNAKLADFGLSKLIDRDQSRVMTVMRGTPGYLAPEWLTSRITEKVDIYSFGVVIMEIISGRTCIDYSQPVERVQLISLLREKAQNNNLQDMIDKRSPDMVPNLGEVIEMMKLAMWCLQSDSSRRPSMSTVVKVLEGAMAVETCAYYNFLNVDSVMPDQGNGSTHSTMPKDYIFLNGYPVMPSEHNVSAYSALPQASILSGPR
ncbi:unnamed protein product [Urochloa decumbens]|uniref:Receptor-like serine/threonine-protein kinase n=1 Tax=Urochloa decumbens TaxID=240449 RepID=A0ABC9D7U0_9POAL